MNKPAQQPTFLRLAGLPGTGKTMLAYALPRQLDDCFTPNNSLKTWWQRH
jgi:adenylylsulfate kinase-like enzyme